LIFSLGVVFSLENSTPHCVFLFLRSGFFGDMIFPSIAYGAELERRFNAPLRPLGFKKGFLKKPFFPFWCFGHCVGSVVLMCCGLGFFKTKTTITAPSHGAGTMKKERPSL
jgi:hypothetical protein